MNFHSDERIAIFLDGSNLYSSARALGFEIDYKNLLELFSGQGYLVRALYYTAIWETEDDYSPLRPLVDWLEYNGYTLVTKPAKEYTDPTGRAAYFSPDGRSMRKAFLRTPVNFTRISSRFSFSRRHPVLHKMRAHRGVDYAAPRGTAVKASGDGRVVFAGRNGGYGRTIILRHGSVYTTLYAHLSRFSKGIRPGKRVEQGQTIGYVGSTGLATGPHLHYEFRVRGAHRDPLRVKLPQAAPLAEGYMDDFRSKAEPLLGKLDLTARTAIATAN